MTFKNISVQVAGTPFPLQFQVKFHEEGKAKI